MTRLAVLLRGVNVGGNNTLPMAELKRILAGLGYDDVRTLLNSGNAIVGTNAEPAAVERDVAAAIEQHLKLSIRVVVRTHEELAAAVAGSPFGDEVVTEPKYYVVWFLTTEPDGSTLDDVDPDLYAPDRWALRGRELYVWYGHGQGKTKIPASFFDKQLGVPGTARNWNTVRKLLELTA